MPTRLIVLVVVHTVLLPIALFPAAHIPPHVAYLPLLWAAFSVPFAQIELLAFWTAMGTNRFPIRLVGSTVGVACVSLCFAGAERQLGGESPFIATFVFALVLYLFGLWIIAGIFFAVRSWVTQIERIDKHVRPEAPRLQFTIFQMLMLTAVVAALFALRRGAVAEPAADPGSNVAGQGMFFIVFVINMLAAVWACLGRSAAWLRIMLVVITSFCLGLLFASVQNLNLLPFPDPRLRMILFFGSTLMSVAPTIVVIASLLVVRSCGYRLVPARWSIKDELAQPSKAS